MKSQTQEYPRKRWSTPQLATHGTVEEITLGCDKQYGGSDGYTFMNQPIVCSS